MPKLSLCMIVKDEEAVLGRCLDSVATLVDEIIIVDTGSSDATVSIALQYTDKVFPFAWMDDFSAARNYAFDRADGEYCMWLDADDVLLEEDRRLFLEERKALLPAADVVMLPYHAALDGAGRPTLTYYRERILRNTSAYRWTGAVHEAIVPSGRVVYGKAAVTHKKESSGDTGRNLRIYEALLARGETLDPRGQFYYGRELFYHHRWEDAARVFSVFLEGGKGWVENEIDACRLLSACLSRLGNEEEALRALLRSLEFGLPRAETCCALGDWYFRREEYSHAAWWYTAALSCPQDPTSGAFLDPDCAGFLPCLQLCLCRYRLGDVKEAREWNEKAGAFKPEHPAYLHNRAFFETIRQ